MSLRAAGSSVLSRSHLCTHMRRCSPPSTASLILTGFQLSIGFGPLLAMPHPDGSPFPSLFAPSQDSSPLKDTAIPIPSAEQSQGLLAQNLHRNSAASLSSHLP